MLLEAKNISVVVEDKSILDHISFQLNKGESLAIVGASGSGKTTLGKIIAGQWSSSEGEMAFSSSALKRIFIPQQHDFRYLSSTRSYYQQRYDSNVADDSPTVKQLLEKTGKHNEALLSDFKKWISLLQIGHLLESRLTLLSNGEGKRVQLAVALLQEAQLLVLDNPFIGLDVHSRQLLHEIVQQLIAEDILVVLITGYNEIPLSMSHVLELEAGRVKQFDIRESFHFAEIKKEQEIKTINDDVFSLLGFPEEEDFAVAVGMKDVTVCYGDKLILDHINWEVRKGEQWALIGHNGAGKSTLLSLINGDNPQAYSNEIYLFDQRRGSGESIWDIKRKVGYISPELHIYFQRDVSHTESLEISSGEQSPIKFNQKKITCEEVVTTGYNEHVESYQPHTPYQQNQQKRCMHLQHIKQITEKN
ncbi:MAG: ABC-type molybdenum transport system, ATPase component/photorepair protein PhrA [Chitinophagaceae bacterium]|nr:ABC-type molybdenum transport system, ATPase component/photorepair protein PhrA [Chitinophagaceae bacterium]